MKKTRTMAIGAFGIVAALSLAACSSDSDNGGEVGKTPDATTQKTIDKVDGTGKTLNVWVMEGDYKDETLAKINSEFKTETGAEVKVQVLPWANASTKLSTALGQDDTPDIVDLGNTWVSNYAYNGALMDLSQYQDALKQDRTWLPSLIEPATLDGKVYAVPSFAGVRVAIYNKKIWADAGITDVPTTYADLTADLDKIKAKNTAADFSPFYLPGKYWYAGMQWIWDAGGDIATQADGKWTGATSSAEAQKGLETWKSFQNTYSTKASQGIDTGSKTEPAQTQIMADGKAATIIGALWDPGSVVASSKGKVKESDLGTFAIPSSSGSGLQPVFGGGSDWGIAAKSKNQDLALVWTKIAAGPEIQSILAAQPWIPNTVEGAKEAEGSASDLIKPYYAAAANSKAAPPAPNWLPIEGDQSVQEFFSSVALGKKTPADAAKEFDSHLDETLNGNS
ncbi:extracellular solute-binding protein [Luteimicrobium subarcticum]|uniref:N,N'-diacetylchitobiose transport system substrate-binding protein n=1 Tax=Luteimicrobium subarcticum TaxID=620910 RepID=A0A2M8WUB3_9MICO|nr:extracellular solute-binding protein [Luteimicrobium subarcticum]PJI94537.1 N,N'-diacetylchitobiose transport system substrate-binding protein [Luteimicrobium subarcticum]